MQALDSFIFPVPSFDGDIPIPAIPISTWPPSDESTNDPSTGASGSTLKTRAGKRKVPANLTPPKKARKTIGKSAAGIKINEPAPNAPASTPPSGPRRKISIQRSKRYAHQEYVSSLTIFLFVSLCAECPRTSTRTPLRRVLQPIVSPQGWTSPRVLNLREPRQIL
jgi:hypothetical protein